MGLLPEGWLAAGLTPNSAPLFSRHYLEEKVGINNNCICDAEAWGEIWAQGSY